MNNNEAELKSAENRRKISDKQKRAMKICALSVVFLAATAYSVYKNGVFGTLKNLLTLAVCAFLGYAAFYLVVLLFRVILRKRRKRKSQKAALPKNTDASACALLEKAGEFNYDKRQTPLENLKTAGGKALTIIKTASQKAEKKASKYYFVNFTVYDAVDIFDASVDKLYEKIDGVFGLLRMQNKPLGFLEKSLENALVDEGDDDNEPKKQSGFKKAVKEKGISVAIALLKNQINAQINDLLNFVAGEAVFVFGYECADISGLPEVTAYNATESLVAATDAEVSEAEVTDAEADKKSEKKERKKRNSKANKNIKGGEND